MTTVNVHEAKTHLSKLLQRAEAGERIVIARNGKPIADLVPHAERPKQRIPGLDAGKAYISEDWDDPLPEFEEYM